MKKASVELVALLCAVLLLIQVIQAQVIVPAATPSTGIVVQQLANNFLNFTLLQKYTAIVDARLLPTFKVGRFYNGPVPSAFFGNVDDSVFQPGPTAAPSPTPSPATSPTPATSPIAPTTSPAPAASPVPTTTPAVPPTASPIIVPRSTVSPISQTPVIPTVRTASLFQQDQAAAPQDSMLYSIALDRIFQVQDIRQGMLDNTELALPTQWSMTANPLLSNNAVPNYVVNLNSQGVQGGPTISYSVSMLSNQLQNAQQEARIMNIQLGLSNLGANFWNPQARYLAVCYRARMFDLATNRITPIPFARGGNSQFFVSPANADQGEEFSQQPTNDFQYMGAGNPLPPLPGYRLIPVHQEDNGLNWPKRDYSNLIGGSVYEQVSEANRNQGVYRQDVAARRRSNQQTSNQQGSQQSGAQSGFQAGNGNTMPFGEATFYVNPLAKIVTQGGGANAQPTNQLLNAVPIYLRNFNRNLGCVLYDRFAGDALTHNMWFGLGGDMSASGSQYISNTENVGVAAIPNGAPVAASMAPFSMLLFVGSVVALLTLF